MAHPRLSLVTDGRCSRPKRDCPHGGIHQHGTAVAYRTDKCGCNPCRAADRRATKLREHAKRNGKGAMVSTVPVLAHINELRAAGMGEKKIAESAGLSPTSVSWIIRARTGSASPRKMIRRETAEKILNVRYVPAPERTINGAGTRRRVQALVANGWCLSELGRRLGLEGHSAQVRVWQVLHTDVRQRTADAIAALYDELWDQPPPESTHAEKCAASKARNRAARNGWVKPMAWDDDEIDNPSATPDTGAESSSWDLQPCGTLAAYRRHQRNGEQPCIACRNANSRAIAERSAVRRRSATGTEKGAA